MMNLESLISNNYSQIKSITAAKAFKYYLDKEELLSAVNERLAIACDRKLFKAEHANQFWKWFHMIATNAALDIKRKIKMQTVDIDEVFGDEHTYSHDMDYDMRQSTALIYLNLKSKLSPPELRVYETFFKLGGSYEEVAKELGISVGYLKSTIFNIRRKANLYFGEEYKRLVA